MNSPADRSPSEFPTLAPHNGPPVTRSAAGLLALLRQDQRLRWKRGERPRVEDYLERHPELRADADAVLDLAYAEFVLREEAGEAPAADEYCRRFPAQAPALGRQLDLHHALAAPASQSSLPAEQGSEASTLAPPAAAACETGILPPMPARYAAASETQPPSNGTWPPVDSTPRKWATVPGYEILGELGQGGMGVVYKARQVQLDRTVALKMTLYAEHAGDDARERFRREAEAVARLQHPNIVQVFEVGEHDGLPYFSLEFCPGGNLAQQLDGIPWEAGRAARLVQTLAGAIHAAHQARVIHRDLKPANVLLTAEGQPKITDFGLAKKLDEQGKTQTGVVMGTPSYMAPEQAGGRRSGRRRRKRRPLPRGRSWRPPMRT